MTPPAASANLWVDPNGGSCARSSTPTPYVDAAACSSFQAAYKAALPGDLVLVKSGSYVLQVIDRGTAKAAAPGSCNAFQPDASTPAAGTTAGCITIEPGPGETVSIAGVWTNAAYLRLSGFRVLGGLSIVARSATRNGISDSCDSTYGHDIIAQNLTVDGQFDGVNGNGTFSLIGTHNVSLVADLFGNALSSGSAGSVNQWKDCTGTTTYSQAANNMLAGSTIHDFVETTTSAAHMECIHDDIATGPVAIIGNRFENCNQQDISIETQTGSDVVGAIDIENNYFDSPASHAAAMGYKVQQIGTTLLICHAGGGTFKGFTVRNNSFNGGGLTLQEDAGACSWSGGRVTGNIFAGVIGGCARGGVVAANLLFGTGKGCGSDTALGTATLPFVNAANYNFDLAPTAGASAYGLVPAAVGWPSVDINGTRRSGSADAGAFQH